MNENKQPQQHNLKTKIATTTMNNNLSQHKILITLFPQVRSFFRRVHRARSHAERLHLQSHLGPTPYLRGQGLHDLHSRRPRIMSEEAKKLFLQFLRKQFRRSIHSSLSSQRQVFVAKGQGGEKGVQEEGEIPSQKGGRGGGVGHGVVVARTREIRRRIAQRIRVFRLSQVHVGAEAILWHYRLVFFGLIIQTMSKQVRDEQRCVLVRRGWRRRRRRKVRMRMDLG